MVQQSTFGHDQRPVPPPIVRAVAAGVALLGVLNIIRVVVQTALTFTGSEWTAGARAMFLILNAVPFAVSVFYLPLAFQLLRGRVWARVTAIVLVALTSIGGILMLLISLTADGFPFLGLAMFVVPVVVLLGLTVPRPVRAYFDTRPAPAPYPMYPPPGPGRS
jgi:hypothetical protein